MNTSRKRKASHWTYKESILLGIAVAALVLLTRTIAYAFDLSGDQAGWLEAVAVCVGILGFAWWRRWRTWSG
jgi:hypothetical protein